MSNCYENAREAYADLGVDTDKAKKAVSSVALSMHCWQGDDVHGFENSGDLSGGIAATGNYPGAARNAEELMADIDFAFGLIPGRKKVNLHAIYAVSDDLPDRKDLLPEHFAPWVDFALERGIGLDMNPTLFSSPMAADSLTLTSPDPAVREYWIEHCIACRRIAEHFGKKTGMTSLNNIWIPDGYKQAPGDRMGPRARLRDSLDRIFADKVDPAYVLDSVEPKLFGIGLESYTAGSSEFYMNYAARHSDHVMCLLDNGHFHPTENVSDKFSSLLLFAEHIALHITRGVRWDSDHVVSLDDELLGICRELVRCDALGKAFIGLDYFDASINRVAAWVIGMRNVQKALLFALLEPRELLKKYQDEGDFTSLFALSEEEKTLPFLPVWNRYCEEQNVPSGISWLDGVKKYERDVLSLRS
ncbi:MAG: L-rhamnose isomerase [Clostridia bacterium]|nr:L-rhamnose isomerase [Clostridia bacterium]